MTMDSIEEFVEESVNIFALIFSKVSIDTIKEFLDEHPEAIHERFYPPDSSDFLTRTRKGITPLHAVCGLCETTEDYVASLMEELIVRGHDVNLLYNEMTPAFYAVHKISHYSFALETFLTVCERLSVFPDMNIKNCDTKTTVLLRLMKSATPERFDECTVIRLIRKLVQTFKADPNIEDIYNRTALSCSIENSVLCQELMMNGAILSYPYTLMRAMSNHCTKTVNLFVKNGPVDFSNFLGSDSIVEGWRIAHRVQPCFSPICKYLLDSGFKVDAVETTDGNTALHACCDETICNDASEIHEKLHVMSFLIDNGANVNAKNADGLLPLEIAVNFGCIEKVKLLVASGSIIPSIETLRSNQRKSDTYEWYKDAFEKCIVFLKACDNLMKLPRMNEIS